MSANLEAKRPKRRVLRLLGWLVLALLSWLVFLAILTIHFGQKRSERPSDAAIVLGAAVVNDAPSPVFAARLDHAVDLYRRGIVKNLILTGGVGAGDTRSESTVGASYAIERGVPADRIFKESVSRTTRQNLAEAKRLMQTYHLQTCLLVSDPLHMRRASIMCADLGIDSDPSPTPSSAYRSLGTQFPFLLRELYFHHHYLLLGE